MNKCLSLQAGISPDINKFLRTDSELDDFSNDHKNELNILTSNEFEPINWFKNLYRENKLPSP